MISSVDSYLSVSSHPCLFRFLLLPSAGRFKAVLRACMRRMRGALLIIDLGNLFKLGRCFLFPLCFGLRLTFPFLPILLCARFLFLFITNYGIKKQIYLIRLIKTPFFAIFRTKRGSKVRRVEMNRSEQFETAFKGSLMMATNLLETLANERDSRQGELLLDHFEMLLRSKIIPTLQRKPSSERLGISLGAYKAVQVLFGLVSSRPESSPGELVEGYRRALDTIKCPRYPF
jgi:hypothetical protein